MSEGARAAGPLVMKFGGTSVNDAEAVRRLAAIVRAHLDRRPVVVVSALSKVTDELSALARDAGEGADAASLAGRVGALLDRHAREGEALLHGEVLDRLREALDAARAQLTSLLGVMAAHPGTRRPLRDEVLSWGERLDGALWEGRTDDLAYVCRNFTCAAPVTTPAAAETLLTTPGERQNML